MTKKQKITLMLRKIILVVNKSQFFKIITLFRNQYFLDIENIKRPAKTYIRIKSKYNVDTSCLS